MIKEVHHIGYIVNDIGLSMRVLINMGFKLRNSVVYDDYRKSNICLMEFGTFIVELIEPLLESRFYALRSRFLNAPYHIALKVDDISNMGEAMHKMGFMQIVEIEPAPVFGKDAFVVFFIHPEIGLIELVQENVTFSL